MASQIIIRSHFSPNQTSKSHERVLVFSLMNTLITETCTASHLSCVNRVWTPDNHQNIICCSQRRKGHRLDQKKTFCTTKMISIRSIKNSYKLESYNSSMLNKNKIYNQVSCQLLKENTQKDTMIVRPAKGFFQIAIIS